MTEQHKPLLEATNGGCYFAECSCGWSGGVYQDRSMAKIAHQAHRDGRELGVGPIKPEFQIMDPWRRGHDG